MVKVLSVEGKDSEPYEGYRSACWAVRGHVIEITGGAPILNLATL